MIGLDAQKNIIAYAVVSTKFEDNKNIVLSFLPLIEHLLVTVPDKTIAKTEITALFEETYGYPMPTSVLNELIEVLYKQNKVEKLKNDVIEIYKNDLEDALEHPKFKIDMRSLANNFDCHLKINGVSIERSELVKTILNFIIKNAIEFNDYLMYKSNFDRDKEEENKVEDYLIDFLLECRKNSTSDYNFIQDIYYGVVISLIMTHSDDEENSDKLHSYGQEKCHVENVLLDSNFVLRLMDLQSEWEYIVAQDTYQLLQRNGCKFWIAPITIKQIADTLSSMMDHDLSSTNIYLQNYNRDRFSGLANACVRKHLSSAKIQKLIDSLEETLTSKDIVTLKDSEIREEEINQTDVAELRGIKTNSNYLGILHDLKLIEVVRRKRPKHVHAMRQAKWWLLTDDNKLTKWNCRKRNNTDIQECITESQISVAMWLGEPKTIKNDGLVNTVLALRNRNSIGNEEYKKISKAIEEQKQKYINDDKKIDIFALVFSKRMLNLEDLLSDDIVHRNTVVEESMRRAEATRKQLDDLRTTNENLETENIDYSQKLSEASNTVSEVKSCLSEETRAHIETLRKLDSTLKTKIEDMEESITKLKARRQRRVLIVKILEAIIIGVIICCIIKFAIPPINNWYKENELTYTVAVAGIFAILTLLGIEKSDCLKKLPEKTYKLFSEMCKNSIDKQIDDYKINIKSAETERAEIQKKIEEKLTTE